MKFSGHLLLFCLLIGLLTTCHKFPNPYLHGTITWTVNNDIYEGKSLAVAYTSHSDSLLTITGFQEDDNNLQLTLQLITAPGIYMAGENNWPAHQVQLMYLGKSYQAFTFEAGSKVIINITGFTLEHISGNLEGKVVSTDRKIVNLKGNFDLTITR